MKLLYLNHNLIWQGAFHRCFQFGKRLVRLGNKVTIVTNDPRARRRFDCQKISGVEVIKSPDLFWGKFRTGWDPVNALRRIIHLRNQRFDLVHAFDTRPTVIFPALYIKKKFNIPLVIDWGDWWGRGGAISLRRPLWLNKLFEPVEVFFEEYFKRYADHITVVSQPLYQRADKLLKGKAKITIIANGSDTQSIKPVDQALARKKLGLSNRKYIAVFSGYVIYDIKVLIEAVAGLVAEGFPITLIIVGSQDKVVYRLGKNLIKNKNLIVAGSVSLAQLNLYLGAADIALLPLSDNIANEARYPMKFGDYLAAGKPVVTNNVGGVGETVEEKKLGITCRYTPSDFAASIRQIIEDKKGRRLISRRCLSFAKGSHNYQSRVKIIADVYQRLLK